MKVSTYKRIKWLMLMVFMIVVSLALIKESALVALAGMVLVMGILTLLRLRVKGVLEDERQMDVGEKAARTAFKVLMPILGMTALAMIASGGGEFYYIKALGIVLSYVTSLGLGIYLLAYWYFNRKYGG